ncbi:hypothetical protein PGT21_005832 [Puccinia graminis f. sp. tritici]|uniref:ribonuclease Z n=1 Tax=Puccinia graminis f. sp. tritici TaxID=56615 RepID=A0A5B0RWG3_PUCGR|nr:hypothetical protein PGT21_005832 [Puccinia graminis f. sp. tritici]KAA1129947.1 hypothetical protein PGTUg99_009423 [Puccinia graminis f. sp. tritici]
MSQRGVSTMRPSIGANSPVLIKPVLVDASDSSSPSLLLSFDQSRYLFNCPENTSRSFVQSRIPQKNLNSIFLSSCRSSHCAGAYGMLMGLADGNKQSVRLIGPEGLRYMLACGRLFTRRQGMSVHVNEFKPTSTLQQVFQDHLIRVYALGNDRKDQTQVLMNRKRSPDSTAISDLSHKRTKLEPGNSEPPTGVQPVLNSHDALPEVIDDMFRASGTSRPLGKKNTTPAYSYQRLQEPDEPLNTDPVSYLVIGPRLRGKFLPEKAKQLGVKPGPNFAKLVNGESVQVNGETVVTSDMCVEGGSAGSAFFISSIGSMEQLGRTTLVDPACISRVSDGANLCAVYHLVHEDVVLDERYIQWISKFAPEVTHHLSTPSHSPDLFTFEASALLQLKLNLIAPSSFPIPHYSLTPALSCPSPELNLLSRYETFSLNSAKSTSDNNMQIDYSVFSCSDRSELMSKLGVKPGLADELKYVKSDNDRSVVPTGEAEFADGIIVTTLGTGSAAPSKYRNVSSTLLHIPDGHGQKFNFVLLDAGEGTMGQIKRKFGLGWKDTLRNLKMIFISHLHADHHCGLASLLAERSQLDNCAPLALLCQYGIYLYLSEKAVIEPLGLSIGRVQWFNSEHLLQSSDKRLATIRRIQALISSGFEIETILVNHWGKCFGVCIEQKTERWKIVFSGDTRPCQALIDAGQHADVLIHEASLGPEETELADTKGHSTIDQAIQAALKMNAKNCVLNHFSGRYPKIPPSINKSNDQEMNIVISFDFMSCKIGAIRELQKCIPALEQMVEGLDIEDTTDAGPSDPSPESGKKTKSKKKAGEQTCTKGSRVRQLSKEDVESLANQVVPEPLNIDSIDME